MIDCNCIYGRCEQIQAKKEEIERLTEHRDELLDCNESLLDRVEVLEAAIRWALGEGDAFPMMAEPPYYRWRTELRERARMKYNADRGHSVAATEQENTCKHEWCDIATGGQYCRLCDARRPEYEGMAYDD